MQLEIVPVTETNLSTFENLYQFYLYEYTSFMAWDVAANGRYVDNDFKEGFLAPDRYIFFATVDKKLAGFAMVEDRSRQNLDFTILMREFFVMRRYQRHGIGRQLALAMFDRFPGRWLVGQLPKNTGAIAFWRKVIGEYTGGDYEETSNEEGDNLQFFDNRLKLGK
jgi:predicted acetyltransferase